MDECLCLYVMFILHVYVDTVYLQKCVAYSLRSPYLLHPLPYNVEFEVILYLSVSTLVYQYHFVVINLLLCLHVNVYIG